MTTVFRCPLGDGRIAAEQDLVLWADGHALRAGAVLERNRESFSTFIVLGIDHRNCAWCRIITGAVDLGNVLIKFSGLRTPSALLEAVGGIRGALLAVKHELPNDCIGFLAAVEMKVTKGGDSAGLAIMIRLFYGIVAQFIGSGFPADRDRIRHPPR